MERSEELLLEVEEIASVGGIEFDLVSGKIKWTAQTYSILGCTEKESPLNSDEFIALFDSNSQRVLDAKLDSIFKGDEVSFVEVKRVVPNAPSKWCKLILRGYYEDDTCTKINVIIQDITELKVVEENNRALHTELLQSHKLEAIGQLASGIAHEINTPAQFVASNINFLKDSYRDIEGVMQTLLAMQHGEQDATVLASGVAGLQDALIEADWDFLSSEIPSAIEQSQEGVGRIASIVQAMKEFSHPGSREKELKDVNAIIQNTITVARNEWKYVAEIELQLSELPEVSCYAGELGQVILNIIVNAAHAISDKLGRTPDGEKGVITITTAVEQDWLKITISDTGSGIPEGVQQKIFDPFFTTKQVGKGSGQGLAIAYDVIVNKHSGNIKVTSKESSGAVFTLLLPI